MRTMNTEKLLKTIPIIQNQMDALLDFNVSAACLRLSSYGAVHYALSDTLSIIELAVSHACQHGVM